MRRKTVKSRMHLTLRAEVFFYAIVEPFILAVGLFMLFLRLQFVYEHTPSPVMDNIFATLVDDMSSHLAEWLVFGSFVMLWLFGKIYRIVQDRRERRWDKEDQDETEAKLDKIVTSLSNMVTSLSNIEKILGQGSGDGKQQDEL